MYDCPKSLLVSGLYRLHLCCSGSLIDFFPSILRLVAEKGRGRWLLHFLSLTLYESSQELAVRKARTGLVSYAVLCFNF